MWLPVTITAAADAPMAAKASRGAAIGDGDALRAGGIDHHLSQYWEVGRSRTT
jgi:hypothetical protein